MKIDLGVPRLTAVVIVRHSSLMYDRVPTDDYRQAGPCSDVSK